MLAINKVLAANEVYIIEDSGKLIEEFVELKIGKLLKSLKLSKSRNSKGEKLSKSQKLAKSRKKLLKNDNSLNFNTKKNRLSFLTFNARVVFNYLRLVFMKALIF